MSQLIKKIEKGQPGGNLYGALDLPDGTWSVDEINARVEAQGEQFKAQYENNSMGDNDKTPTREPKPTPAVVKQY